MELIKIINANSIISNFVDESVDAQLAYKLMKFVKSVENEVVFFQKQMQKLLDKYSDPTEDGGRVVPAEKVEDFNAEVLTLQNTEVEAPKIYFTISELSPLKMSMRQMFLMSEFIEDSE